MNIAYEWFMNHGLKNHDFRTTKNVIDDNFVKHAKSCANADEIIFIDKCIEFQKNMKERK